VSPKKFQVIIIGGGHAGVEAAWAAANLLPSGDPALAAGNPGSQDGTMSRFGEPAYPWATVALITLDPSKVGVMSCNPAIGGLAKGQIVREIDAFGGLMGLATDATGIQFKLLNTSKGAAVHGPRAQCDKHAYAERVQHLIASRSEIEVIGGAVERLLVEKGRIIGVTVRSSSGCFDLHSGSIVLTTGTFMRGLMHTGETMTPGGRFGEDAAVGISGALRELGFELGRLKTGTPPRLKRSTIRWEELEPAYGDAEPAAFSELSVFDPMLALGSSEFPVLPQIDCRVTTTNAIIHEAIRANIHRAPMYSGQIESIGPRYCPSIEDKVVRFEERQSHHVYLEPESLRDDWIYCNGISTSLPADVQEIIVRNMRGCEGAHIYRYGYAVEYDMVKPHQISASGMTKLVEGLFLAGQINGTSGYEEAAGQGLIAGVNAARRAMGHEPITLGRNQAYIGVMMDDLVTKTPTEPYRMFTSRAEHRLMLRSDNAPDRLTPLAIQLGLLDHTELGRIRKTRFDERRRQITHIQHVVDSASIDRTPLAELLRRQDFTPEMFTAELHRRAPDQRFDPASIHSAQTERFYAIYIERQHNEIKRHAELERRRIPPTLDYATIPSMRNEARHALQMFRPDTLGQAARLEGITPADVTLLSVLIKREHDLRRAERTSPDHGR